MDASLIFLIILIISLLIIYLQSQRQEIGIIVGWLCRTKHPETYSQYRRDKERINNYLLSRGATKIFISKTWFDFDKDVNTYDVEYINNKQNYCRTICKVQISLLNNGEIYWKEPP